MKALRNILFVVLTIVLPLLINACTASGSIGK